MPALTAEIEDLARIGSFERDLETGRVSWSPGMYRLFGGEAGGHGKTVEQMIESIDAVDLAAARAELDRFLAAGEREFRRTVRIARPDGQRRVIELVATAVLEPGRGRRLVGIARDVTDEVDARRARDLLGNVVESSDDAILTHTSQGVITSWNRGAEHIYGYTAQEAIGRHIGLIVAPELEAEQAELTARVFAGESIRDLQTERLRKDGTPVAVSLTISPVLDRSGQLVSAAIVARDVTERRRYEQRLQHLADHDSLTGLYNRRRFDEEVERELSRAARSGSSGAVLSIDLDNFKAINDSAGHAAGDTVLREVARTLDARLRDTDLLARLGGDEFAVLLPSTGPQAARVVAEELLQGLRGREFEVDGTPFHVSASIGVALVEPGSLANEILVSVDLALYAAKTEGRDRIVVFTEDDARDARANTRLSWSHRIRRALAEDRFVLHWQPVIDLSSGATAHGELLLRMRDGGKVIGPGAFLSAAERLGMIHSIDRWVVRKAIQLLAHGEGPAALPLSVNLSGESVANDAGLLALIASELEATGVDPRMLMFETTETAALTNIADARTFAHGVRALGCRLALDDFGTGFGSFYHLKHLPVDFLKVDREFIQNVTASAVDQQLVRSIVEIAHSLEVETIAEAVGDDRTIELLREVGIDYIQGFYVAEPRPVEIPR